MKFKHWLIQENKNSNIIKIDIFDFDNTLVFMPCEDEAINLLMSYNLKSNNPVRIPRSRYWDLALSLKPPIVPDPAPISMLNQEVAKAFYASSRDHNRLTVVLTGRHNKMQPLVERILKDYKLNPDRLYLTPYNADTLTSKVKRIAELIEEFPNIEEIEMWEDRGPTKAKIDDDPTENHIAWFRKYFKILNDQREIAKTSKIKIKINEVLPKCHHHQSN